MKTCTHCILHDRDVMLRCHLPEDHPAKAHFDRDVGCYWHTDHDELIELDEPPEKAT